MVQRIQQLLQRGLSIGEVAALGRENLLGEANASTPPPFKPAPEVDGIPSEVNSLLLGLAPLQLSVRCPSRFSGDALGVSLRSLDPADVATIHRLYQIVKGLYEVWNYMEQRLVPEIIIARLQALRDADLQRNICSLGASTQTQDILVRSALEDARQGALALLLERVQEPVLEKMPREELKLALTLARDHAKMMRNAFYDLDGALRRADEVPKSHDVQPILRKLSALRGERLVRVGSSYDGPITSRCLEASALDRVLYDFLHRSKANGIWLLAIDEHLTRWAFESSHPTFPPHQSNDLSSVVVAAAVGVGPEEALRESYLGSKLLEGRTWSWFHWPIYQPAAGVPSCVCDPMA